MIDVFYKIVALHEAGVGVHLHCYENHRPHASELENYCASVHYYPRKVGFSANFGTTPYIVAGRMSEALVLNLLNDDYPILFEGLHTCGLMRDRRLRGRFLVYRESNIEHHYYFHLFRAEKNLGRKLFFLVESARLKLFQKVLVHASLMLPVSQEDTRYLLSVFPGKRIITLPSFHRYNGLNILTGQGNYALYHGNLSVAENSVAAEYLVTRVWEDSFPELIIAGLYPPGWLLKLSGNRPNIRFIANPSDEEMLRLIREAQLNIMVTFQPTGLKLKLLNALFNGRFCLVNPQMVTGTSLGELCVMAPDAAGLKKEVLAHFIQPFTGALITRRETILMAGYSNQINCKLLMEILNLR